MLRCSATVLLLALSAASADPSAASNDLVSSSARFGHQRSRKRSALQQQRQQQQQYLSQTSRRAPADCLPAPGFPTTVDAVAEAPHYRAPLGRTVGRAVLVIAAVVLSQTLGDSELLPSLLRVVLSAWQNTRAQWPLVLATACAFCLYGAADVLSQCTGALLRQTNDSTSSACAQSPASASASSSSSLASYSSSASSTVALDLRRTLRTAGTASFLSGFLAVFYFGWLESAVSRTFAASWLRVLAKVAVDVGVYEPIYDTLYITLQALLRGEGLDVARREVSTKVLPVWRMAPRYWIAADLVNFGLMPLRLRPMTNALFSIPWGMYLSSMANAPA